MEVMLCFFDIPHGTEYNRIHTAPVVLYLTGTGNQAYI